jgi:hypothetical protein
MDTLASLNHSVWDCKVPRGVHPEVPAAERCMASCASLMSVDGRERAAQPVSVALSTRVTTMNRRVRIIPDLWCARPCDVSTSTRTATVPSFVPTTSVLVCHRSAPNSHLFEQIREHLGCGAVGAWRG